MKQRTASAPRAGGDRGFWGRRPATHPRERASWREGVKLMLRPRGVETVRRVLSRLCVSEVRGSESFAGLKVSGSESLVGGVPVAGGWETRCGPRSLKPTLTSPLSGEPPGTPAHHPGDRGDRPTSSHGTRKSQEFPRGSCKSVVTHSYTVFTLS